MAVLRCQGCKAITTKQNVISDGIYEARSEKASFSTSKRGGGTEVLCHPKSGPQQEVDVCFLSLLGSDNAAATRCCLTICHITAAPAQDCQQTLPGLVTDFRKEKSK